VEACLNFDTRKLTAMPLHTGLSAKSSCMNQAAEPHDLYARNICEETAGRIRATIGLERRRASYRSAIVSVRS